MKLKEPRHLEAVLIRELEHLEPVAKFDFSLDFMLPGLAKPLVTAAVKLKGLYHGANYAIISSEGTDSMNQGYSLFGQYYRLNK